MDEATFLDLVEQASGKLYRVASTMLRAQADCMDAYQEALLKAWANRHKLRDVEKFSAWLTRILVNECRNIQRRQWRLIPVEEPREDTPEQADFDPSVRDAVEALPEKLRLVVVLHYLEGFPLPQVAHILRISHSAARTRLYRARELLRLELNEQEEAGDEA